MMGVDVIVIGVLVLLCNTVVAQPAAPTGLTITGYTSTSISFSWTASAGATSYEFNYYESGSGNQQTIPLPGTGTTHTLSGLNPNTLYELISVQAVNAAGTSSESNEVQQLTKPAAPTGLKVTGYTASSISLTWTASTGATGHEVNYYEVGTGNPQFVSAAGTSYTLTGLNPGESYEISVQAVSSAGTSGKSNTVEQETTSAEPSNLQVTDFSTTTISLEWTSSVGATNYILNYYESWSCDDTSVPISGTGPTYTMTGLNPGTLYELISVQAVSNGGTSDISNEVQQTTKDQVQKDPHMETFDGLRYNFQGLCTYVLTQDCKNITHPSFQVTAEFRSKFSELLSKQVTRADSVNIIVGGKQLVRILNNNAFMIKEGELLFSSFAIIGNDEGAVRVEDDHVHVELYRPNMSVSWTKAIRGVSIIFHDKAMHGNVCGLLGNSNGDMDDDLMKPNGVIMSHSDIEEFGNSWEVSGSCE